MRTNRGCNNCKHYKIGKINFNLPDSTSTCSAGHVDEFKRWWIINGNKKQGDILEDMSCFEETELGEILNDMSELLDEIDKKL